MLNWGFAHADSHASRVSLLPRPRVLASLTALCRGGYMDMTSISGRMHGDGFVGREVSFASASNDCMLV